MMKPSVPIRIVSLTENNRNNRRQEILTTEHQLIAECYRDFKGVLNKLFVAEIELHHT
jgi:hypothetical protein